MFIIYLVSHIIISKVVIGHFFSYFWSYYYIVSIFLQWYQVLLFFLFVPFWKLQFNFNYPLIWDYVMLGFFNLVCLPLPQCWWVFCWKVGTNTIKMIKVNVKMVYVEYYTYFLSVCQEKILEDQKVGWYRPDEKQVHLFFVCVVGRILSRR